MERMERFRSSQASPVPINKLFSIGKGAMTYDDT